MKATSPYRHMPSGSIQVKTSSLDSPTITTAAQDPTKGTADYLARRLRLAMHDLGLLEHLPSDWFRSGQEGLSFRHLGVREAGSLVLAVEDLASSYTPRRPTPGPDQLRLF